MDKYADLIAEGARSIFKTNLVTNSSTVEKFEKNLESYLGTHVAALSSCTAGLMLTAQLLGLREQEIIMPSFTFCATAISMSWCDCKFKFVDIDEKTFNLSPDKVSEAITPNTKAILATHIFGNVCDIKALSDLAADHKMNLFFDSAHGLGGNYNGTKVGNFGNAEIFSCSPTKLLSTIEGGIVSSNDISLIKKMKVARNYGVLEDYNVVYQGLNARLGEVNAALGLMFMEDLETYVKNRNNYAKIFINKLKNIEGVSFQKIGKGVLSTYKDFAVVIDPEVFGLSRDAFSEALSKDGIPIKKYFYPPVHKTDLYKEYASAKLPITEKVASNIVCLPIYNIMGDEMIDSICDVVIKIKTYAGEIKKNAKK